LLVEDVLGEIVTLEGVLVDFDIIVEAGWGDVVAVADIVAESISPSVVLLDECELVPVLTGSSFPSDFSSSFPFTFFSSSPFPFTFPSLFSSTLTSPSGWILSSMEHSCQEVSPSTT